MSRFPLTIIGNGVSATVALGLGGNIGDPSAAMALALQTLNERDDCTVLSVSKLYSTPPWGKLDQADFFNCCALVQTSLAPAPLLDVCLELERLMKRVRLERWGPRTLDIDILLYDDQVIDAPNLSIPHPRMLERAFVLQPLADIADGVIVSGRPVAEWLEKVDASDIAVANANPLWWQAC
ncbi:2-amino-4-hydroxy-6-hydroxymethyldihydropteridine diphosphokinase [Rhizobium sp.]|jgi:2-amino-4-hydroxy-6-hydroxymethyldihydropteridine diphosphokinase|uniref:2-amino-4-hydroxy-6- hydroxymethyldihydropteridine diphosphokinase n=1 Tax=Rhizobium sp. TaxID=391 RepID=UPI000E96A7EA|nr:2-amino-4-hydroxy-6-hydroxymethyldihydropteridine diphosphokinase [Rhizobium sp.]